MADGSTKRVEEVVKGDLVRSPCGGPSRVTCVVETLSSTGTTDLVHLEGGLKVTPYHPVRVNGKWNFPCTLSTPKETLCPAVYSFVLVENHVVVINGIECVTLGHGFTGDAVIAHPYFGTQKVILDLQEKEGWKEGRVVFRSCRARRDEATGMVTGLFEASLLY